MTNYPPRKILMVCSGNTCRSPLAAAMLQAELAATISPGFEIDSAGIGTIPGQPASLGTLVIGSERGLDLSAHRSRQITLDLIDRADLILTMGKAHLLVLHQAGCSMKATTLLSYAGMGPDDVPDPFGGTLDAYRSVAELMAEAIRRAGQRLQGLTK